MVTRSMTMAREIFFACFDTDISESVIEAMARKKPLRVVFRDGCFSGSQDKINVFEIFKMLSPDTTIRVL